MSFRLALGKCPHILAESGRRKSISCRWRRRLRRRARCAHATPRRAAASAGARAGRHPAPRSAPRKPAERAAAAAHRHDGGRCAARRQGRRDHVYVIQPNTSVAIADGVLSVTPRPDDRRPHYPVDHFLRSLAAVQGPHAVGVILSGTGSDGTLGICEIKAAGGLTFAQDEHSAQHAGMPQSAIASGAVDLVLPPEEIAARLAALPAASLSRRRGRRPRRGREPSDRKSSSASSPRCATARASISASIATRRIKRRTARRMLLRGFTSPRGVRAVPRTRPRRGRGAVSRRADQRDQLLPRSRRCSRISSARSSRRSSTARRTGRRSASGCRAARPARRRIRSPWRCSSSSTTAKTQRDRSRSSRPISATRRRSTRRAPASTRRASRRKSAPSACGGSSSRRSGSYRIQKSVRDLCVFARQNVTVDPPFSRVDLVTCRNVLIYMSPPLQERLLPVFHFALNPGGFLVLGWPRPSGRSPTCSSSSIARTRSIARRRRRAGRQLTFMADEWLAGAPATRPGDRQPAARRLPARGRPRWCWAATRRRACWSTTTSRCSSFAAARRPTSKRPAASRRRTCCAWPSRACSWSCAAR